MEDTEVDDLRKLALSLSLKLNKLEEEIKQMANDKECFRRWYHEERDALAKSKEANQALRNQLMRASGLPTQTEIPESLS